MKRNTYLNLDNPDNARQRWFDACKAADFALPEETVPLAQALHRIVARPVAAKRSSPAFHGAAMDGVAVRAEDTFGASPRRPMRLKVGEQAFWINTGHPLPQGCNAVIMVEKLNQLEGGDIEIEAAAFPWQHVRKLGEDMVATEIILAPGTRLGPWDLGALACGGVMEVPVFRKPRVAIIPSGSEIVPLAEAREEDLLAGKVLPEFNSLIFSSLIAEAGGVAATAPIVPDDPQAIRQAVSDQLAQADMVLINAGSSAGSHDYTAHVLGELGEVVTHGIAVMPGKPTVLACVQGKPVIGVPGYPISAGVAMEEFVLPLLAQWQKTVIPQRASIAAMPCNALPSRPGMEERVRVKLGLVGDQAVAVALPRGAGTVTSLSRADGVVCIPRDSEGYAAGQSVDVQLLRPKAALTGALLAIGSHDNTLDLLDSLLRKRAPAFRLTSAHVGSLGGLMAIKRGQCHLAGCHLLDPDTGVYNQKAIADNLTEPVTLLRLVDREQGILVLPGNPLGIQSIADLAKADVRFVNRQKGAGTRVLFDYKLSTLGLTPNDINGYMDEEYTHMGVAAAVLSGRADAGLAVRASANALGLEFIPVGVEEYDLVIPQKFMELPSMQALLGVIRSDEFKEMAEGLGGYGTERTGEVVWEYGGHQHSNQ